MGDTRLTAKAPKITPAQRELEALQARTLREQEREQNAEASRVARRRRRMLLGDMGYQQLLNAPPALPVAQTAGTVMAPDLTDPAAVAMQRREEMLARATGFGRGFAQATQAVRLATRI